MWGVWISAVLAAVGIVLACLGGRVAVSGYVFAPLCTLMTLRAGLRGIRIDDRGVVASGWLVSKRVPWENIDRFELRPIGRTPYVAHVIRTGGGPPIGVLAIYGSAAEPSLDAAQRVIDDLNRELRRHDAAPRSAIA